MALEKMKSLRRFLLIFTLAYSQVQAADFYLSEPNCKVLEKLPEGWKETITPEIAGDSILNGSPSAKRPDLIMIQKGDRLFAFPRSCLSTDPVIKKPAEPATITPPANPVEPLAEPEVSRASEAPFDPNRLLIGGMPLPWYLPPPPSLTKPDETPQTAQPFFTKDFFKFNFKGIRFGAYLSMLTWQETPKILSGTTSYDLRANIITFGLGGRLHYDFSSLWSLDSDLGILIGDREVSSSTSSVSYYLSSGNLFGATLTPRLRLQIPGQTAVSLAASVPLIWRQLDIPRPSATYTVETGSPIFAGFLFEPRFAFNDFEAAAQVGLFRELSSIAAGFELSYHF